MKKFIKLILVLLVSLLSVTVGKTILHPHTVEAASYGRLTYTTPKKIRGIWISHDKRSIYSRVKITAHTITLKPTSSLGEKGKWTLYKENSKWGFNISTKKMIKAQKLGPKYHWARAFNYKGGTYIYYHWMNNVEENGTGTFYRIGKKLKFDNNIHSSTFVKSKYSNGRKRV